MWTQQHWQRRRKLTPEQAAEIRRTVAEYRERLGLAPDAKYEATPDEQRYCGVETLAQIGRRYGLAGSSVSSVASGRRYAGGA